MAHYDGSIKFDTSIDSSKLESGIAKLKSVALKGAAAIGTAFTAAAGYAINLASDLEEVQNVVDVTFGDRAADIDAWAKNAANAFGLSELQAKQFNGTMGAMIKSMGLTDSAVYEMSTTLTGLAADFASFYNLEHQEAFDKIRAGISGETEPLKQLGINMSVANLEAFALSQGITKSYNAMSQAEQVTLRYNYLLKAGADAQGDFARTSDSFANQLKIAKLNVSELAAEFGETLLPITSEGLGELSAATVKLKVAFADPELRGAIEDTGELLITLIDSGVDLATAVLPPLIQTLGFVGNNMRTLTITAAALVAGYEAFSVVSAVNGWISANTVALAVNEAGILGVATATGVETAALTAKNVIVGVLTGQIGLATAAQWLWNTAISANSIGIAIGLVAAFAAGIAALVLTQEKETEAEKANREAIEGTAQTVRDATQAYEDYRQQQAETAAQNLAEVHNVEKLSRELFNLADANGKVTNEKKSRAQFILNELNEALGTEYTMTGNIINQYDSLKKSVYELIEAKKYEILMNEASSNYEEALKGQEEAAANASKAYSELMTARANYEANASKENEEALNTARIAYAEAQAQIEEYNRSVITYEEASSIAIEEGTQNAIAYLQERKQAYADAQNAPKEYESESEKALIMAGDKYRQALINFKQALDTYNESGSAAASAMVSKCIEELEGAKEGFKAAGGKLGQYMILGLDGKAQDMSNVADAISETLQKAVEKGLTIDPNFDIGILNSAQLVAPILEKFNLAGEQSSTIFGTALGANLEPVKSGSTQIATAGTKAISTEWSAAKLNPLGYGFSSGLATGINQGGSLVSTAASNVASLALTSGSTALKVNSPSKAARDMLGKPFSEGLAVGISSMSSVVAAASAGLSETALNSAKSNLQINSPAKRSRDEVGRQYSEGIALGIEDGTDSVISAATELSENAIASAVNGLVKNSDKVVDTFNKSVEKLDYMRKLDIIDEAQYYAELERLRNKHLKEDSKEWLDATVEIYDYIKQAREDDINDEFAILEHKRNMDIISESEYYTEIERLRDKYFTKDSAEWRYYTEMIYGYQKELLDNEKELYKETYDRIFEYTSDKIDAVIKKQEDYTKKLKSYSSLFEHVTIKLDEGDIEYYRLADLKKDTEALKEYNELMTSARDKILSSGISEEAAGSFLSELNSYSIDEGTGVLRALMAVNDKELSDYLKAYEESQSFADHAGASMYASEMDAALDESMQLMKDKLTEAGFEIPETFFDAGKDAAAKFGDAFSSEIDVELNKIKEQIESFKAKIKVDVEIDNARTSNGTTVYKYYGNNTYQLGNSGETTQERLESIRRDEEFRRMSGEGD